MAPLKAGILLSLLIALLAVVSAQHGGIRKASQCFKSRGIPKVSFACGPGSMIQIRRAFHGIIKADRKYLDLTKQCKPNPPHKSTNCSYCQGDCVDDSMNQVYDWSSCMGNTTCKRTVMQSYMNSCRGKKFSDYLQVEYKCVPKTNVVDICKKVQRWMREGYIMSPNYPYHYPINQNCICNLQTDWGSKIQLSFYDLLLETKGGRCRADWLMLRQKGQKHRHCGAIITGTKNFTSESNALKLQFHSDKNDNKTQSFHYFTRYLKGFWLHFKSMPSGSVQIKCRRLTPTDKEVQEIRIDDADYDEASKKSSGKNNAKTTVRVSPDDNNAFMDRKNRLRPSIKPKLISKNKNNRAMEPGNAPGTFRGVKETKSLSCTLVTSSLFIMIATITSFYASIL